MSETDLRGILSVISRGNSHPKDGVALWLEVSVFWMGFDAPHYAFRRFLSPRLIEKGCDRASAKDFHEIRAVFTRGVA